MGEDRGAVVDSRLKVRGMQALRVIDASVMPSIPSPNIHPADDHDCEKGLGYDRARSRLGPHDIGVVDNGYQIFSFRKYHSLPDIGVVARPRAEKNPRR
jgi:GMC oxidoreductase